MIYMVFMGKVFKRYLLAGSLPCLYGTKKCNTLPQKNAPPPYRKMWDIYRYYLHRLLTINLILPYKPGDTGSKKFTGRREG